MEITYLVHLKNISLKNYLERRLVMKKGSLMILVVCSTLLLSCGTSSPEGILKPEILYRSPALDFTKVQTVAIMPVNNYDSEIPEVSGSINDGLPVELKSAQKAWQVISYDEVLRKVNEKSLGRGYQNYVADLNTYVQAAGRTPNFTAETFTFFEQLKKEMNFQAMIFTSYGYTEQAGIQNFMGIKIPTKTRHLTVTTVLYDLSSRRAWWLARLSVQGGDKTNIPDLVRTVTQGIAQNFGKGTLRQL